MTTVYLVFSWLLLLLGAAVMALEILASSMMSPYFGGSVHVWGSIISTFLVHLSIGYVLGGYLAKRTSRVLYLIMFLIIGSLWVVFIPAIHRPVCEFISGRIADVRLGSLCAMNLIFFVPITTMAMVSPYVIGLTRSDIRLTAGVVLFISTLGSFVGTNVTAFYLIDMFPVSKIVSGLGLICLLTTSATLLLRIDRKLERTNAFNGQKRV